MNKSMFDRFFPPSKATIPQNGRSVTYQDEQITHTHHIPAIPLRERSRRVSNPSVSVSASSVHQSLHGPPLSASLLHHDDPFLPIDRAAKALQSTIQLLLDAQSRALGGRASFNVDDDLSAGSLTPTQSISTEARSVGHPRTMPIRQPSRKKTTLRGARKGLGQSMKDFAVLREEELRLLNLESTVRAKALERAKHLGTKKEALTVQIDTIKQDHTTSTAQDLRHDAQVVQSEISELEHRLLELKVKHRHLLSQADEIENSLESKVSSYSNTLAMVEREIKSFLRRPPVQQPFAGSADEGIYGLKAERRTLEMAKEQWTTELHAISERAEQVEAEHEALVEGETVWSEALARINQFEISLRSQTRILSQSLAGPSRDSADTAAMQLVHNLSTLVQSLERDLDVAQQHHWNLLVCALGAELQACMEAKEMLDPAGDMTTEHNLRDDVDFEVPVNRATQQPPRSPTGSVHSNQSLKDTLVAFGQPSNGSPAVTAATEPALHQDQQQHQRYESEDDEPPVDFLLSH